jgi:hypothetical protein
LEIFIEKMLWEHEEENKFHPLVGLFAMVGVFSTFLCCVGGIKKLVKKRGLCQINRHSCCCRRSQPHQPNQARPVMHNGQILYPGQAINVPVQSYLNQPVQPGPTVIVQAPTPTDAPSYTQQPQAPSAYPTIEPVPAGGSVNTGTGNPTAASSFAYHRIE